VTWKESGAKPKAETQPATVSSPKDADQRKVEVDKKRAELDAEETKIKKQKLEEEAKRRGVTVRELEKLKLEEKLQDSTRDQQRLQRVDRMRLFEKRKSANVNAELFEFHSKEKLDNLYNVLLDTGAFQKEDLDWMRDQLSYSFEHEFENDQMRHMYQFPDEGNNLDLISRDEIVDGRGGRMFVLALTYFQSVREILTSQQASYTKLDAAERERKNEPLSVKLIDKVEEIGSDFVTAFEERDYAKLAVYGGAIWALISVYNQSKSSAIGKAIGKYLPWAVGIYTVTAIAAPDVLKKVLGKGIDVDLKGTSFENLAQMQKYAPEPYLKSIDLSLAATLANASVKDLYRAMASDPNAAEQGMVTLTAPGVGKYLDPDIVTAKPPAGYPGPFTAKQKLHIDMSKRLFATLVGLRKMYESNTLPTEGTTFEEKFLSEGSDEYTLHALVDQLSVYASNYQEMPWDDKLLDQARKELDGNGAVLADVKGFEIVTRVEGKPYIRATYQGFPLIVKIFDSKEAGRSYRFYLANECEQGATPIASYNLNDANRENFKDTLHSAVKFRITRLLNGVTSSKGDASGLEYDGQYWSGDIKMPAVEEYGIDAMPSKVKVEFAENGTRAKIHSDMARSPIFLDEMMSTRHNYGELVVNKVLGTKEYNALNAFAETGDIQFEDLPENDGKFVLRFTGNLELEMKYNKETKKFVSNAEQEKKLVKSYEFRDRYLKTLDREENGPFKVFDKLNSLVSRFPQEYVMHFGKKLLSLFTGGKEIVPLEGVSSTLSGSIPNYYSNSVILAKKYMVMNAYDLQLQKCDSLADINEQEKIITDRLQDIEAEYKNIEKYSHNKQGKDWAREEFTNRVIEPLKSAGLFSTSYKYAIRRFENSIYNHLHLQATDLREDYHQIAAKLFDVYSYYTIGLDSPTLDRALDKSYGVTIPASAEIPPPKATIDVKVKVPETTSVNEDVRSVEQYFLYVEQQITTKALAFLEDGYSLLTLPPPNSPRWGIEDYKTWEPHGSKEPLDELDSYPPWKHTDETYAERKANKRDEVFTELEEQLFNKYDDVLNYYTSKPEVNSQAMREFFEDQYMNGIEEGCDEPDFYHDANLIYKSAKRRSNQRDMINGYAQRMSDLLFQPQFISADGLKGKVAKYLID
jgi:hypothetical protein